MRLLVLYLFLIFNFQYLQAQTNISYFNNMLTAISSIKTLEYDLHSKELIDGDIFYTHSKIKLQKEPFCFYNYILNPDLGVEILFTHKNNYALINTNGFPFVNLRLDPYGKLIRKNQHHTLFDAGFDFFRDVVLSFFELLKLSSDTHVINLGVNKVNNVECQVFKVVNPSFFFREYIVQHGEDVESIAKKFNLSSYLILLENNLSFYNDISFGDIILIPNSYAEEFEIWIDLQSYLPIVQKIFVNNSLFEYYEYKNIIINPKFSTDEFSKSNKKYNF